MALIFVIVFVFWWDREIVISKIGAGNSDGVINNGPKSSITGESCERALSRPIAVMLAGDVETRPVSGISQADLVIEMPVAPNGITRFMAVYQCELPDEMGSIRSSRLDFVPLARGFKTIYAHWGGEAEALALLNKGVIDNIDALKYENVYYYRKKGMLRPHNGFISAELINKAIIDLKYDTTNSFSGYPHANKVESKSLSNIATVINVDYQKPFDSAWAYDSLSNIYKRTRDSKSEIDQSNGQQVSASIVAIMKTDISFWRDQYMRVDVIGSGEAQVYQGGIVINAIWKKETDDAKLGFYDSDDKEIKFLPGKIWIEVVNE